MLNGLLVSNLLLWIVVLATVAVMFALVRQIGVLYERVAPAGAPHGVPEAAVLGAGHPGSPRSEGRSGAAHVRRADLQRAMDGRWMGMRGAPGAVPRSLPRTGAPLRQLYTG